MPYSRYKERKIFINASDLFSNHFSKREVSSITQYSTPTFLHVDPNKSYQITEFEHIWKSNDRLYKLSYEHYGTGELWWIIAWYNKKPTEAHFQVGDKVYIPKPIEMVLNIMGV